MSGMEFPALLWLFLVLFAIVLCIAWIVLPFAVMGTKPLLRQLLAETRRTNELLERARPAPPAAPSAPGAAAPVTKRPGDW